MLSEMTGIDWFLHILYCVLGCVAAIICTHIADGLRWNSIKKDDDGIASWGSWSEPFKGIVLGLLCGIIGNTIFVEYLNLLPGSKELILSDIGLAVVVGIFGKQLWTSVIERTREKMKTKDQMNKEKEKLEVDKQKYALEQERQAFEKVKIGETVQSFPPPETNTTEPAVTPQPVTTQPVTTVTNPAPADTTTTVQELLEDKPIDNKL